MGKAKRKINPKVENYVEKELPILFLKEAKAVVFSLPDPWVVNKTGRRPHKPKVITVINMLKEGFHHTFQSVAADVRTNPRIKRLLRIKKAPSKSAIHRGRKKLKENYIKLFNKKLTYRFKRKGMTIIVDASGFTLKQSSTWFDIRIKRDNKKKDHDKLHIAACADTGIIFEYTITDGKKHDSTQFERLMKFFNWLKAVIGDRGYLSRKNCNIVATKKGKPFFLPKKNVTMKAKNSLAWKKMLKFFKKLKEEFLEEYHKRSFIEAVFMSIKSRFGSFLRAFKKRMQRKELALKVIAYNIKQVLYNKIAKKLGVSLYIPV